MRILILASSYHPHIGGVETVVRDLATGLRSMGDRVLVVTNLWPGTLPFIEVVDAVTVVRVPMVIPGRTAGITTLVKLAVSNIMLTFVMLLFRPAIINIQCVGPNGYWGKRLVGQYRTPLVVSTHGERTNDSSGFYLSLHNAMRYSDLITTSNAVVCVSEVSATESMVGVDLSSTKISIIPNAISVSAVPYAETERYVDISFVGRLVPEKGIEVLLRAIRTLKQDNPNLSVMICGDGPSREQLEMLVEEWGLQGCVEFTGHLDRDEVTSVLQKSKVLVLPSRKESFGIVLIEAANAGCAVVATRTGGIPAIVDHGSNGLLFDIDSDEQLVTNLQMVLENESVRLALVSEFRQRLPMYDVNNFVTTYRTLFATIASQ
jgi:glycogen(starch) synthase